MFTPLQVKSIPSRYVLRRYMRNIRVDVSYDRLDLMQVGPDRTTEMYWHSTLLREAMDVIRSGCGSSPAYNRSMEVLKKLQVQLDSTPNDIGLVAAKPTELNEADDSTINPSAPHLSQTKCLKCCDDKTETPLP